jgi:hypothetical protein
LRLALLRLRDALRLALRRLRDALRLVLFFLRDAFRFTLRRLRDTFLFTLRRLRDAFRFTLSRLRDAFRLTRLLDLFVDFLDLFSVFLTHPGGHFLPLRDVLRLTFRGFLLFGIFNLRREK